MNHGHGARRPPSGHRAAPARQGGNALVAGVRTVAAVVGRGAARCPSVDRTPSAGQGAGPVAPMAGGTQSEASRR